jgi:spore coat protein H
MKRIVPFFALAIFSGCSFFMNEDAVDPYSEQESAGLPIFYLHPKPVSKDFYTTTTVIYKGHEYDAKAKIRGATSSDYPKKSYTLKFSEDDLFSDSDLGDSGFLDREKVLLIADFDDNSHLRNRLAQKMWALMQVNEDGDEYSSMVIQTDSAVVYTNGSYEGLYTVIESVDENYLERCASGEVNPLEDDLVSGGNLYKALTHDADFYINDELSTGFEKKEGTPEMGEEGAYEDLENLIYFINDSSDSELEDSDNGFSSWASLDSYYGWWFFTTFLLATDSMEKNAYHYHEPDGLWYYLPWDFNGSFGQNYSTERISAYFNTSYITINAIFNRVVELSSFEEEKIEDYDDLLADGGNWDLDNLLAEVDTLWSEIEEAANDDWDEWGDTYIDEWSKGDDYTTPEEEVIYMKEWIAEMHKQARSYLSN